VEAVLAAMRRHSDDSDVQLSGCTALKVLAVDATNLRAIADSGGALLAHGLMRRATSLEAVPGPDGALVARERRRGDIDEAVAAEAFAVVAALSSCSDNLKARLALASASSMSDVLDAMRM
jgi:hypothetical protein